MRSRKLLLPLLAAIVVATLVGVLTARSTAGNRSKQVVETRKMGDRTLLVDHRGRTLYRLSAEKRGRFICTNRACLALWKPLLVKRGVKPTGFRSLGTVRRPDHRIQVTYRGGPLYTFAEDEKPGDVEGDGFKDVGVWHVVTVRGSAPAPTPAPSPGGYGY